MNQSLKNDGNTLCSRHREQVAPITCDIFCQVIDNLGDIGVCWRLAQQLSREYQLNVRLWVDDLKTFQKIFSSIKLNQPQQTCGLIQISLWNAHTVFPTPGDLVIEGFGCPLPETFIQAMATRSNRPCWINLEYLSAETWVESHHLLPSPHPRYPLVKHFFFPGFTAKTGGLLKENSTPSDLVSKLRQQAKNYSVTLFLFTYNNNNLTPLIKTWAKSTVPMLCILPQSPAIAYFEDYVGRSLPLGQSIISESLHVYICPQVNQPEFDALLTLADINFVRGEDSFTQAQWKSTPIIWDIYPQEDNIHLEKLAAYADQVKQVVLSQTNAQSLNSAPQHLSQRTQALAEWYKFLWSWNMANHKLPQTHLADASQTSSADNTEITLHWQAILDQLPQLKHAFTTWKQHLLQQDDLTTKIMTLFRSTL